MVSVPPRLSEPNPCSNALGETAVAITASAPPSFFISSTGSCSPALTGKPAPSSSASRSLSSKRSTATAAPDILAYWTARCPRPLTPKTATRSEGRVPETFTAL